MTKLAQRFTALRSRVAALFSRDDANGAKVPVRDWINVGTSQPARLQGFDQALVWVVIALLAVPILIQVLFSSGLAYLLNRAVRSPHCVAGPSALIGASNFFELAVATAIVLFGFHSGAALATVVGVLIEVPVMLAAVHVVNNTRGWYERRTGVMPHMQCCPWDVQPDHAR